MNLSSQLRLQCTWNPQALVDGHPWPSPPPRSEKWHRAAASIVTTTTMRDRAKNRKPNQRGRYLSIEAIQAVQALKRSGSVLGDPLERVLACKVRRLIKGDMVAVLLELQSQREGLLALKVFEEVRKEHWYKPQLLSYNNMIELLASCSLPEEAEQVFSYLKTEHLGADTEGFNSLLKTLLEFGFIASAMDCFRLMKLWESEPDESTYSILINGLKAKGETDLSMSIRHEAEQHMGGSLEFIVQN
ncbi:pentatricopeptide repeat-containing protein At1g62350-like [Zingiber officinale]|uniref:pentatricopeptide repeat-containing protein At1g62350-like n=1 Tax=Zingiber officinale TaxID=94328 RepID=UPI001C4D1763|nr:pentatricopeptide repeat-containing protein At1g62350-like [Zingiber officinale]